MKRSIGMWQLFGFALASILGTLLHYLYDWLGKSLWIAPFSGVNESTWEHMKLLFWPLLLFAVIEYFFVSERKAFWCVKLRGTLLGLILIPVLFYTYNGAIGRSPDLINISIFFLSAAAAFWFEARLFQRNEIACRTPLVPLFALALIGVLFVLFTFFTPKLGIFLDPATGKYGM